MSKQRTRTEVKTAIDVSETAERKRGRPQAAQGTDLKLALLRSAIDLFAERGFDGASIRDIATAAGAPVGLVHHHGEGKEELFRQVVARRADELSSLRLAALEICKAAGKPDIAAILKTRLQIIL